MIMRRKKVRMIVQKIFRMVKKDYEDEEDGDDDGKSDEECKT
jgi:hypothetical protein